jgi:hypothetical protein
MISTPTGQMPVSDPELLLRYDMRLSGSDGVEYTPTLYGQQQPDSAWRAWFEFTDAPGSTTVLTTLETNGRDRDEVIAWARALSSTDVHAAIRQATAALAFP